MLARLKSLKIMQSLYQLQGNTFVSVIFEPLWGIPFVLYNFYLSLYMIELGVTPEQLGYLIAIGSIAGIFFSAISGMVTDALGRKKTTFIFEFLSWPLAIFIFMISNNFWLFALATVVNSLVRIVFVSWNLMVVEDADCKQQITAYTLLNIINISVGIITPLAGLMVSGLGIVKAERIIMGFAVVSMTAMIFLRNHFYTETKVGQEVLEHRRTQKTALDKGERVLELAKFQFKPALKTFLVASVLFNAYIPIGGFSSLYFAPYLTEALKLNKSIIALMGGIFAATMFLVLVIGMPLIHRINRINGVITGILIQMLAMGLLVLIPTRSLLAVIITVIVFAAGFGITKPLFDSMLAEYTEGRSRARLYALNNSLISVVSAILGFGSGYLFHIQPALIYVLSLLLLLMCLGSLFRLKFLSTQES